MKALLINLESSKDRLQFQTQQLGKLGIPFDVLKAVSTNDISHDEYEKKSQGWERPLRQAEVACFLSHLKAWNEVVKKNKPMLVLEDDALLSVKTAAILVSLFNIKKKPLDLVTLETRSRKKIVSKAFTEVISGINLRELYQDRTGAAGYVLWPSGAKKLIEESRKRSPALADAFISSSYNLNAYQIEPAAIIQLDQCDNYSVTNNSFKPDSTISSEVKPQPIYKSKLSYIRFKGRRIYSQLRMAFRQLSVIAKSTRQYIYPNSNEFYSDTD
ncbi:glycosyltransferase family 25 protein [Leucothrix arctica]|uniref:Glycosyl transferase family 25 domain-containing protein n=1 Tax=Leucothrix arctica TaxID=1481894 RepID=A0A317C901_9GAMM|nr:glycosyltransferase family 25 protein [Leucothrix arctica]PWQ94797.1 hypothetical protein DKT75_15160 [Leucothrix arctica]